MQFGIRGLLRQTLHETSQQLTSQHRNVYCKVHSLFTGAPSGQYRFRWQCHARQLVSVTLHTLWGFHKNLSFVDEISLLTSGKLPLTSSATRCSPWDIQVK
jgi:hypothetical protein